MVKKLWSFALAGAALLAFGCDEITTTVGTTRYVVRIDANSDILITQGDTLVNDSVLFVVTVLQDGQPISVSDPIFASSDPAIVAVDSATGQGSFKSIGQDTVRVKFSGQTFPDSVLTGEIVVPVDSFVVTISASSETVDANGEYLLGDTVQFSAAVTKQISGEPVTTEGQTFTSSNPSVLTFIDATAGLGVFVDTGQAAVGVEFDEPKVPDGDGTLQSALQISVSDFSLTMSVASVSSGAIAAGDTLVTDNVQFSGTVVTDGMVVPIVDPMYESSDPAVVRIDDPIAGLATFLGAGTATVRLSFTQPVVPQQEDSLVVEVGTFIVNISGPVSPVMGTNVMYSATVTDTRTGQDTAATGVNWTSSDPTVVEITNATTGQAFIRDIGQANAMVSYTDPTLPNAQVTGSSLVDITEERFYGAFSVVTGDFGDPVFVDSSGVHKFTDSTRVFFPNGTVGFVTSATADLLRFTVGAGTNPGPLLMLNLVDETGAPRDSVLTEITFVGQGTVADSFELNNTFPLAMKDSIGPPFLEILSIDPTQTAPPDSDFFYMSVPSGPPLVVNITVDWQQDANLDFFVCNGLPGNPPPGYLIGLCSRDPIFNNADPTAKTETATNVSLGPGHHVLGIYCRVPAECPTVPVTYRLDIN